MRLYLVDVNVLLSLLDESHVHAGQVTGWISSIVEDDSVLVCRAVEMSVLRLLTTQAVMGMRVLNAGDAWDRLMALYEDDRFIFFREPAGLAVAWEALCRAAAKPMRAETDMYLAAFAISGNLTLVSFDKGMSRFNGLSLTLL